MKWTKRFAVILAAVCCLCGCTKSTIISPEAPSDVELAGEDIHLWSLSAQASLMMRIQ